MQYLRALFPEAFARQLHLQGLQKVAETPVWLYMPVQGPVLEGETLWGGIPQDTTPSSPIGVQEAVVKRDLAVWLRVHRTILYEVETPNVNPVAAIPLEEDRLRGKSLFLVGSYHQWPMAVTQVLLGDAVAQVVEPAVIWPWVGLGIEEALIERAINLALARNRQIIYTMGAPEYDPTTYRRLGFIQLTHLMTYSTSPESPT
jgi:GNAT superfamily N-acetyltransferase